MSRYVNVSEVPLALAVFLASDNYDFNSDPNTISATILLKPVRQIVLPSRIPTDLAVVNLADQMSNRIGSAIHDSIENAWKINHVAAMQALGYPQRLIDRIVINPTDELLDTYRRQGIERIPIYLEQRLSKKVGAKWTVTGKFDFVGEGRVQDFKSASVWSYQNQVNADKQVWQGSIYRWLNPKLITQDQMDIHHIFVDWRANGLKTEKVYPPRRFHTQTFGLKSVPETQAFIERKLAQIDQYWNAQETDIPPCEDVDLWRGATKFKYYKSIASASNGSRSTKNFDTYHEAQLRFIEDGSVGIVKEVRGEVRACKYCAAFAACTQKDQLIRDGDLVL